MRNRRRNRTNECALEWGKRRRVPFSMLVQIYEVSTPGEARAIAELGAATADIVRKLRMERSRHPIELLLQGEWR